MLRNTSGMLGYGIGAIDGDLGRLRDFYFDDDLWIVRYLVVDSGSWLPGRKVLISPYSAGEINWETRTLHLGLTKQQIKDSPPIDSDKPLSRQIESEVAKHFGWPIYWGPQNVPKPLVARSEERLTEERGEAAGSSSLRSTREVTGYRIDAADGEIGHVEEFIVDVEHWTIRYLAVDTRNWLPGRKVLVARQWIDWVSWTEKMVGIDLTREEIKSSPEYDPSATVNREYETRLYDYYGRPRYWD